MVNIKYNMVRGRNADREPGNESTLSMLTCKNTAREWRSRTRKPIHPWQQPARKRAADCLYVVATPIGNLEDITLRALRMLKEADLIACEDTRQTLKLLSHFDIQKRLVSYHEHNEITRAPEIVIELEQGAKVALVSDAGTPAISDPGHRLMSLCLRHGIKVSRCRAPRRLWPRWRLRACLSRNSSLWDFCRRGKRRGAKALRALAAEPRTLALYEAPHRLSDTLEDALEILGNRPAVIAREVTKMYEEFLRGHIEELLAAMRKEAARGEITLLIGAAGWPAAARGRLPQSLENAMPLARPVEEIMKESRRRPQSGAQASSPRARPHTARSLQATVGHARRVNHQSHRDL